MTEEGRIRRRRLAELLRRRKVAELLRRKRLVKELRKRRSTKGKEHDDKTCDFIDKASRNLLNATISVPRPVASGVNPRAAMDQMLEEMESRKRESALKKYDRRVPQKTKQIRVVVAELKQGCEQCLAQQAAIYSIDYEKYLCLDCEEKLDMSHAGVVSDNLKKRRK